jgi:hypothetical protein
MNRTARLSEVTFVRCPDAIPNRASLLNQVLWADRIVSIWPDGEPTPRDVEQEKALADALTLRREDIFRPTFLEMEDMAFAADGLAAIPKDVLVGRGNSWSEQNSAILHDSVIDTPDTLPDEDEASRFLYPNKLPEPIARKLTTAGLLELIEPDPDHPVRGYRADSAQLVPWLLTKAAQGICERAGEGWTLVPSNVRAVKVLSEPKARARKELALAMGLPTLPVLRDDVVLGEVLELRSSRGFLQARADYRGHLDALQETVRRECRYLESGSPRALEEFQLAVGRELEAAREGVRGLPSKAEAFKHGSRLATFLLAAAGALLAPGLLPILTAAVVGADILIPILVRERSPEFLRMSTHLLEG